MENKPYSINEKASKSFGTFILTLSISLIVFSAIYYLMTKSSLDSGQFNPSTEVVSKGDKVTSDYTVQNSGEDKQGNTQGDKQGDKSQSVFAQIADKNPNVQAKEVLAGSTTAETPQTTTSGPNPDTGIAGITIGLFLSLALFLSAIIFVFKNPRNIALSSFEKRSTKRL